MTKLLDAVHAVEKKYQSTVYEDETDPIVIAMHRLAIYGDEVPPRGKGQLKRVKNYRIHPKYDDVMKMIRHGWSTTTITREAQISATTLKGIRKASGDTTDYRRKVIAEMYDQGKNEMEIALYTNRSLTETRRMIVAHQRGEALRMYRDGLSVASIAATLGLKAYLVNIWISKNKRGGYTHG